MKDTVKRVVRTALDPFGVQLYFVLFSFLTELPLVMQYVQFWKKVGLIWAAAVILWDLCTRRRCLKARLALPVFGLLAFYAVTVVTVRFAYPAAFQETYLDWFCSIVTLLVLYPPTTDDRQCGERRLGVLNWLLILLTTVVGVISLWMFAVQFGGYFHSDITNYDYPLGFVKQRLTGLYRNAIYPTALIGLMAAVVEWVRLRGRAIWQRVVLVISVLVNFFYVLLTNSRSTVYALALFAAVLVLLLCRHGLSCSKPKAWLAGAICAVAVAGLILGTASPLRRLCGYLPPTTSNVESADKLEDTLLTDEQQDEFVQEPVTGDPNAPIDMDRDTSSRGTLTGRPAIWKLGVSYFLKRPVFGYGPYALKDQIRISETSTERLSHFHNIFLHSLVSVGVCGSVFFFALLLGATWLVLRFLLRRFDAAQYTVVAAIGAMLASLLFLNLADTTLFFLSKNSEFVFWIYLGYAFLFMEQPPLKCDSPLLRLDARLPALRGL